MAWTAITDPSSGGTLETLFFQGGTVYLGGIGHVWTSTDHGGSWTEIGNGGLPATAQISAIALAPDGTIVVGHNNSGGINPGIYYWSGSAWVLATGYPAASITLKISSLISAYGRLFMSTAFNGDVYRSLDNGHTWSVYALNATIRDPADSNAGAIWAMHLVHGGRLAVGGELGTLAGTGGIFRDPRTGGQWVAIGPLNSQGYTANEKCFVSLTGGRDGILFAGRKHSADGHYVSKSVTEGVFAGASTGLAINQTVLNLIQDATGALWESQQPTSGDGNTYRSVDNGANWAAYASGLPASTWAIDRGMIADDLYVYMLANTGGIYRAPAGG